MYNGRVTLFGISLIGWFGLLIALSTFVISFLSLALARNRLHVVWGLFCAAVCVWSGSFFAIGQVPDARAALWWWKVSHIGVILIPVLFLHFVLLYLRYRCHVLLVGLYAVAFALIAVTLSSDLMIADVRWVFDEMYYDTPGPLYPPFVFAFVALVATALFLLRRHAETQRGVDRLRSQYLFVASSVGFIGGVASFAPVFQLDLYPVTILTVAIAPPVIGYAILRYHLFDMRVVLSHFLKLAASAAAIGQLLLSESSKQATLSAVITLLGLISAFYFIRQFDRKTNEDALD